MFSSMLDTDTPSSNRQHQFYPNRQKTAPKRRRQSFLVPRRAKLSSLFSCRLPPQQHSNYDRDENWCQEANPGGMKTRYWPRMLPKNAFLTNHMVGVRKSQPPKPPIRTLSQHSMAHKNRHNVNGQGQSEQGHYRSKIAILLFLL